MKVTIRVSEHMGCTGFSFIADNQKIPLLPNERELFQITKEGDIHSLADILKAEAREEATRRGIKVENL